MYSTAICYIHGQLMSYHWLSKHKVEKKHVGYSYILS